MVWAALAGLGCAACLSSPDSGGGDGEPGGDSGPGGGDAGPSERCGTTRALHEDFEVAEIDLARWTYEQAAIDGGAAELWATPDTYGIVISRGSYRVAGGDLKVELNLADLSPDSSFELWLDGDGSDLGIRLEGTLMELTIVDENGPRVPKSASYDADRPWWRLWEEDGKVHFGTATDGEDWNDLGGVEWGESLAQVSFALSGQSGASTVDVRTVNPDSDERCCAAASFTEEFDDLDRWWQIAEGDCSMMAGGKLSLSYPVPAACTVNARERFDLRGSSVSVELLEAGDCQPSAALSLAAGDFFLDFLCTNDGSGARLSAFTPSEDGATIEYVAEAQRFIRLRHDPAQGAVLWETRPEGGDEWEQFEAIAVDDDLVKDVEVRLFIDGEVSADAIQGAVFDNLNL